MDERADGNADEYVDVVVVGSGISGIGAGYHLQTMCPNRSYLILEGRHDIGGTWDLFRYPGVRSDSDMHTLGYRFKPWTAAKAIADGPSILAYLRETVAEFGIDRHIRFGHSVRRAEWSSEDATWTVSAARTTADGRSEPVTITCNYLFMCAGYYSYTEPYDAGIPGLDRFEGHIVHPQFWPDDLAHAGERVVVIGSGATAMTLVPAMAETARRVTMLQRSPTYVVARPDQDAIANGLRRVLPEKVAYAVTRRKNVTLQQLFYDQCRKKPAKWKGKLVGLVRKELPEVDVDTHFTPRYGPWDQRLCLLPNGDLYEAIRAGRVDVVTDTIDTVTPTGIRLSSGRELDADIIVTATGLQLVVLGGVEITVDGRPVDFSETWTYKGFAYSDVPNLASSFGYINASWTLRADLTCEYVCRLLNHMDATGTRQCTPRLRPSDSGMPARPWIVGFSSGYVQRVLHQMPKQGDREPWINPQRYSRDRKLFRKGPLDDGVMTFTRPTSAADRTALTATTAD
jgi:cation diffusion facilitator CzcD-associated flavoprotein CzcO